MPFLTYPTLDVDLHDGGFDLHGDMVWRGHTDTLVVKAGLHTDLASVPAPLTFLLPRYGGGVTRPALLHDDLCRQDRAGLITIGRSDIDGIFRKALLEEGVTPLRAQLYWAGVRLGCGFERGSLAEVLEVAKLFPLAVVLLAPAPWVMISRRLLRWLESR